MISKAAARLKWRMCLRKISCPNRDEAQEALECLVRCQGSSGLHIYRCPLPAARHFHVGHQPRRR